jgi:Zn-dependent metalloprotease
MNTHHNPILCIVPPHILHAVARNGTPDQRAAALGTLSLDAAQRAQRMLAVTPIERPEPGEGLAEPPSKRRSIHDTDHTRNLPGPSVREEGDPPTGDADADRVYDGFGATWDLYFDVYGRNSYDDAGATLTGTVHFDTDYNNAFWDGSQMVFGDGDGVLFISFTSAVDVTGHELTHAVTSHESDLVYRDQSGALNESLSDVFGSLVKQRAASPQQTADQADWLIGAGILGPDINGVALRSMKAPGTAYDDPVLGKDPQPAHMDDFVDTSDDNGGVHINSGIPNHAIFRFATALGGFAWEQAGKVWYDASIDDALAFDASFQDFADLTASHASKLFGPDVAGKCVEAWAAVGINVP